MRFLIFLVLLLNVSFSDVLNLSFRDFIMFVSSKFEKTFLYDEDINKQLFISVPNNLDFRVYLKMIKSVLVKNGFYLEDNKDFYYIKKIRSKYKVVSISSNLDINISSKFNITLKHLYDDKYAVFYKYTSDFLKFNNFIHNLRPSSTLKLTGSIYRINKDVIKNKHIDLSLLVDSINKFASGAIVNIDFYKSIGFDLSSGSFKLSSYLNFLNEKGILSVVVRPNMIIASGKKVSFHTSKIYRLPNQIITSYDKTIPTNTTTYEEKEAGLKIDILPSVFNDKVKIDLVFEDSNYQNTNDNNFVKNLISFNSSFYIPFDKDVAIAGLSSNSNYNLTDKKIPILSDLPIIKNLFNSVSKSQNYNSYVLYFRVQKLNHKSSNNLNVKHIKKISNLLNLKK